MNKREILSWLFVAIILAFFISPFASSSPDGLEKVAEEEDFLEKGEIEPVFLSPIPDYTWPGIDSEAIATGLAGIFGTMVVFGVAYGIGVLVRK